MDRQKKSFKRADRVGDRIREEIADLLLKTVKDPRIGFVTMTGVEMSDDLRNAKVYVSVLGDDAKRDESMAGLQASAGFIQREVWKRLEIKVRPEIRFYEDDTARKAAKIEGLLNKLKEEGEL